MDPGAVASDRKGLTEREAYERLERSGPNRITSRHEITFLGIAKEEITEPMILLLLGVGVFYTILGSIGDALTLYVIIVILVLIEIANEYRAKKAISSLAKLAEPRTRVVRDGSIQEVVTEEVVPGDLLVFVPGTRVAADGKIVSAVSLQVDESSLTGESFPQDKVTGDEVSAGTLVIAGEGLMEAEHTGGSTRVGKLAAQAEEIRQPKTPLQLAMKSLVKVLVLVALFFSIGIPLVGFLQGQPFREMFLTGLALAFATIPEELPIIITMNLGLGAYMLSKENFLVKKLKAAETLGNATVIVTDKTGTLTGSTMHVASVFPERETDTVLRAARSAMTGLSDSITDRAITAEAEARDIPPDPSQVIRERSFETGKRTRAASCYLGSREAAGLPGEPRVPRERPEHDLRVLADAADGCRPSKRVSTSSGSGASKSAGIRIRPFSRPNCFLRGRAASGTSRATGLPAFAITISRPRATSSTRRERWVLASWMLTVCTATTS